MRITTQEWQSIRGRPLYSQNGEQIGSIDTYYREDQSDEPKWLGVSSGFLGMKHTVVPIESVAVQDQGLVVPFDKDTVKDAPDIQEDQVSDEKVNEIYSYYGITSPISEEYPPSDLEHEHRGDISNEGRESMTRSEEELRVGRRERPAGNVRLRKWVETEPVTENVDVRQETAHVERHPVDRPASQADIHEEEIDVPLTREEPVVQKETVAREEVSVDKEVEVDRETVSEELRKERIEVDEDRDRT